MTTLSEYNRVIPIQRRQGESLPVTFEYGAGFPDAGGLDAWTPAGKVRKTPLTETVTLDLSSRLSISGQVLTLTLSREDTAALAPGIYHYGITITLSTETFEIISGTLEILASAAR